MSEWLDVVDDTDTVIDRATRDEIHARGLMHRAVHVLLFNSRSEVFVQLRSLSKDNSPGLWDTSAAGHVDSGESYLDCAVRELNEELGVTVAAENLLQFHRLHPSKENGFEFVNVYKAHSDAPLTLQAEEIDDGRWLTPTELADWMADDPSAFTYDFHVIWQNARSFTRI